MKVEIALKALRRVAEQHGLGPVMDIVEADRKKSARPARTKKGAKA